MQIQCVKASWAFAPVLTVGVACLLMAILSTNRVMGESYPVPTISVATDGAVDINAKWETGLYSRWYIEMQRYGAAFVEAGIQREDPALIQRGLTILSWGFAHQSADGSFGSTSDPFHSTTFFVEAAARATLMLAQYKPVTYTQPAGTYAGVITSYTTGLRAAAGWLMQPAVAAEGQILDKPYTHRRWMLAAALGEIGQLTGDTNTGTVAVQYARAGAALQIGAGWQAALSRNSDGTIPPAQLLAPGQAPPPDTFELMDAQGVDPEMSGYDVSYQSVGLVFAEQYLRLCPDTALQAQIASVITHGLTWEYSRADVLGTISTIGSTRVGVERDRSGNLKQTDLGSIRRSFAVGYSLFDRPCDNVVAIRMTQGNSPVSHAVIAADGAVNTNAGWESGTYPTWSIGLQSVGADYVKAGVVRENASLIQQGLTILNWGFAHQSLNGSFAGTASTSWGTATFTEAAARAALLLRQYHPATYNLSGVGYGPVVTAYITKAGGAAQWLSLPATMQAAQGSIATYTSRNYGYAAALSEAGVLIGSPALASAAVKYINSGLALQQPNGANPEKGTDNVNDQAVGIDYAAYCYAYSTDTGLRTALLGMIDRGLHWESGWVSNQGEITGTSLPNTGMIDLAFCQGHDITGRADWQVVANRIESH